MAPKIEIKSVKTWASEGTESDLTKKSRFNGLKMRVPDRFEYEIIMVKICKKSTIDLK